MINLLEKYNLRINLFQTSKLKDQQKVLNTQNLKIVVYGNRKRSLTTLK